MPARGEMVGDIYVRSHVDGRGMDRELANAVEKFDADKSGKVAGRKYGESFSRSVASQMKTARRNQLRDAVRDAAVTAERTRRIFQTKFFKGIEKDIRETFTLGNVADKMIDDLKKAVERSGKDIDFFKASIDEDGNQIEADVDRFLRGLSTKYAQYEEQYRRETEETEDRLRKAHERTQRAIYRTRIQNMRDFEASYLRLVNAIERANRSETNFGETASQSLKRTKEHVRELAVQLDNLDFDDDRSRAFARNLRLMQRELEGINPRFRTFHLTLDRTSSRIGRLFGRGSRSDLVNFFGAMTEGMVRVIFASGRLVEGLFNAGKWVGNLGKEMFDAARNAGSLGAALARMAGVMGSRIGAGIGSLAAMGPAILAALAALAALSVALGVVVSAISSLVAAVTALVSSLSFALLGSLAAVAGALVPIAAGLGVVAAAILSMSDAQKQALAQAIRPFTREMKELGRIASTNLFKNAENQAKGLAGSMRGLRPIVAGIAKAMSEMGDVFIEKLNSKSFADFLKVMEVSLPTATKSLGAIFLNTFGGLGGLIRAAFTPLGNAESLVQRFLTWMQRLTGEFSAWANSAKGQEQLVSFFQRAGDSAAALGGLMKQVVISFSELFSLGKNSGDSILGSLEGAFKRFTNFLRDNPSQVKQWFEDGKEMAESVGRAILSIIGAIDAMDTPENRARARAVFEGIGSAIEAMTDILKGAETVFRTVFGTLGDIIKPFAYAIAGIIEGLGKITPGNGLEDLAEKIRGAADSAAGLNDEAGTLTGFLKTISGVHQFEVTDQGTVHYKEGELGNFKNQLEQLKTYQFAVSDNGSIQGMMGQLSNLGVALGAVPPVTEALITDQKTAASTSKEFIDLFGNIKRVPGTTDAKVSDKGTNAVVQRLLKDTNKGLDNANREVKSKVKGEIFPFNFLSTLQSIGTQLGKVAGSRSVTVRGQTKSMAGRIATKPMFTSLVEDGKAEAVVPLERPLHLVDPAVREIAAFAQGKLQPTVSGGGRTIDASGWTVVTQAKDPEQVAQEVLNNIVGALL